MLTISACQTKRSLRQFERLPEHLLHDSPNYVPPFPGSVTKFFGENSCFKEHGELYPFMAFRNGKAVGRIAAIINRSHNKFYKDKTGFFGFFDCIDDKEASNALFEKAESVLRDHGMNQVRGPYSPSVNEECGLLVEGFDTPPMVMMPYNPEYYESLLLDKGFNPARKLYALYMASANIPIKKIERIQARVRKNTGITIRNVNMKKLKEELVMIGDLYNSTLDRNWGYVPVTSHDLESSAEELKQIVQPDMLMIAEKNGKAVGFALALPNINQFLWEVKDAPLPIRVLRFIWKLKTQHPNRTRMALLGVDPEYRNTGIAAVFYYEAHMRARGHYHGGELSWIDEDNEVLMKSLRLMGAEHTKTYQIYQKALEV